MKQDPVVYSDLMAALVAKIQPTLDAELTNVKVGVTIPKDATKFVQIRRDGGRAVNQIVEAAFISATIIASNYGEAEAISRCVELAFQQAADGNPITMVETITAAQDISSEAGQRRFIRFEVQHRGSTYN
jgi:hypothetical protein